MKNLKDYSGEFIFDLNFADFSHDTLVKLLSVYAKLYIAMDGFWYLTVMDRSGNDEALACDIQVWKKVSKYEMKRVTEALNITGKSPIDFLKALQVTPWFRHMKCVFDIKSSNEIVMMVTHCPTLEALEKEGKGRQNDICGTFELNLMHNYAALFNPEIKVESLAPLPRQNRGDICCKCSFKLGA